MFLDFQIAQHLKCCRTKTSSMLNEAIHPRQHTDLVSYVREFPFSFCHDRSSDSSIIKTNPMCVTIFDNDVCNDL